MATADVYFVVIFFHHAALGQFARAWESPGSYEQGCSLYRELRAKHERGLLFNHGLRWARIVDNHVRKEMPVNCPIVNRGS
jgi:hypothetical protein